MNHEWILFDKTICCKKCGVVKRFDDKNSKCKGKTRIKTR